MKYQLVRQHTEEDCGAACLATVAKHYGRNYSLSTTRDRVGTSSGGTTLLGLRRGADSLGFNARQVKASAELIDRLHEAPLPAIIHWKGIHWAVLYGAHGKRYVLADPGVGVRHLTKRELLEGWADGIMLLLDPDESRFFEHTESPGTGLGPFLRRVWPHRTLLLEATAMNLAVGLLALAFPITTQLLTDDVLVRQDSQLLTTVVIGVLVMNLFQVSLRLAQSHLIGHFGQRLQLALTLEFGHKLLSLPMSFFDRHRSGEVVSRVADVVRINNLIGAVVFGLPSQAFVALVSALLMSLYSWRLTVVAFGAFAVVVVVNTLFLPALRQQIRRLIVEGTENQGFLVETFRGALAMKTSHATPQVWEEYQQNFGRLTNLRWSTMKLGLYRGTLTMAITSLATLAILWLGGQFVIAGAMSIGQLLAFYGMSLNFLAFAGVVISLTEDVVGARIVMERLAGILEAPSEGADEFKKSWVQIPDSADIRCDNLTFHHVGRVDLVQDFSHTFQGGQITALVGPSGCGKTTLAKLIAGLYELQSGNIRFGHYNQKDLPLECLREQVVLVPQDPHFWSRSILENFRLSFPGVGFDRVVSACQMTGADDFISELPDKYQTVLGEFGVNLSGGQRQRLALARAVLSDPPVLILDEATDSLDPRSEDQVLDDLFRSRHDRTTILISHRPRVVRRADWMVLVERGRITVSGSVQELLHQTGDHLDFLTA